MTDHLFSRINSLRILFVVKEQTFFNLIFLFFIWLCSDFSLVVASGDYSLVAAQTSGHTARSSWGMWAQ